MLSRSGGEGRNSGTHLPPPEIRKVVENWCYLPWVTFGEEAEIPEILSKEL